MYFDQISQKNSHCLENISGSIKYVGLFAERRGCLSKDAPVQIGRHGEKMASVCREVE